MLAGRRGGRRIGHAQACRSKQGAHALGGGDGLVSMLHPRHVSLFQLVWFQAGTTAEVLPLVSYRYNHLFKYYRYNHLFKCYRYSHLFYFKRKHLVCDERAVASTAVASTAVASTSGLINLLCDKWPIYNASRAHVRPGQVCARYHCTQLSYTVSGLQNLVCRIWFKLSQHPVVITQYCTGRRYHMGRRHHTAFQGFTGRKSQKVSQDAVLSHSNLVAECRSSWLSEKRRSFSEPKHAIIVTFRECTLRSPEADGDRRRRGWFTLAACTPLSCSSQKRRTGERAPGEARAWGGAWGGAPPGRGGAGALFPLRELCQM